MYNHETPNNFKDHSYDFIVCMITGKTKKRIDTRYLKSLGYTRERYQTEFPNAPFISTASRNRYKKHANSTEGRTSRSKNLTKLCADKNFLRLREDGFRRFLDSDDSIEYREKKSIKAKEQHKNGLADHVRKYFDERFEGSQDQRDRKKRMEEYQPMHDPEIVKKARDTYIRNRSNTSLFSKHQFQDTHLLYQSSYEKDFIEFCLASGVSVSDIQNGKIFNNGVFYESDFVLYGKYIVEVKSSYIEKLQEQNNPHSLQNKEKVVTTAGFKWLYVLDKNYEELQTVIYNHLHT